MMILFLVGASIISMDYVKNIDLCRGLSFLLVVCPDPGTEKMIHDPFWGAVIYLVMVAVVYAIIWGIALSILINL